MSDYPRLRVQKWGQLEQGVAAPRLPACVGAMQHQALSTPGNHPGERSRQRHLVIDAKLRHGLNPGQSGSGDHLVQAAQPQFEGRLLTRQIKDHVAHLLPGPIVTRLPSHQTGQLGETPSPQPQLTIERTRGQAGGEPGGRRNRPTTAKAQTLAVPIRPYAVQLFAHPARRRVQPRLPAPRQHQGRRRVSARMRGR